ncbi:methyltransferase domain-containing protein [Streptomyces sp. NBC_00481]|uniref:SAM-dependent methyltransferase n=1 Tax=unclassified Streptomyces TaxID=2593676 RepID=UPI002DDC0D9D|nr:MULTISPECIES: methyltransferase domain-containing protein [unclassified Streptomyces]WRY93355.1 methyltransferase domain-containing protein [Streptomyces sp. NBC_00481]
MGHEQRVRTFYDYAGPAYEALMDDTWHHGDPAAEARGLPPRQAARALEERLVRLAGLRPGDRALDFGSGVGGATLHMAARTGATFVGLSNNEWLSQRARRLAAERRLADRVQFLTVGDEDYTTLAAWPDMSFDAITFYESVCHLPRRERFFRSAHRLLKPGGTLVGVDWLQRPFGPHRTPEAIAHFIDPVNDTVCLAGLGTLHDYESMLEDAGFLVTLAEDLFPGIPCWGSTPPKDRPKWLGYDGPGAERIQAGKHALDAARGAGVFTVGAFAARRPDSVT